MTLKECQTHRTTLDHSARKFVLTLTTVKRVTVCQQVSTMRFAAVEVEASFPRRDRFRLQFPNCPIRWMSEISMGENRIKMRTNFGELRVTQQLTSLFIRFMPSMIASYENVNWSWVWMSPMRYFRSSRRTSCTDTRFSPSLSISTKQQSTKQKVPDLPMPALK